MSSSLQPQLLRGFSTQIRVLYALIRREMMLRYGRSNVGFLWIIIEPMLLTGGVMLAWSLIKPPYEHGISVIAIVLTGYMPLTLYRHISGSGVFLFRANSGILYHRHISLLDTFLSKLVLEICATTCALVIVYSLLWIFGLMSLVADPGVAALGWVAMIVLSAGIGLILAVVTELVDGSERFVQPIQYLMIPISGAFFMIEWLPSYAQKVAWYSPFVHCFEMFRAGVLGESVVTHFTWWYPFAWGGVLLAIGFLSLDRVRDRIGSN